MGVNEAGRPLIHTNHGYGHGVAEAPKSAGEKTAGKYKAKGQTRPYQTPGPPLQNSLFQKPRMPPLQRSVSSSSLLNVARLILLSLGLRRPKPMPQSWSLKPPSASHFTVLPALTPMMQAVTTQPTASTTPT